MALKDDAVRYRGGELFDLIGFVGKAASSHGIKLAGSMAQHEGWCLFGDPADAQICQAVYYFIEYVPSSVWQLAGRFQPNGCAAGP